MCFDTETTSLNALQAELVGIAFSWENHKGYYLPFPTDQEEAQKLIEQLRPFFEDPNIEKIGHNLKYDLKVLSNYKLPVKGPLYDTLIAHYLINPDRRHGMDILAASYLNYEPQPITDLIGKKGKNQGSMRDVPLKDQTQYAVEDADITWQLKQHFEKELTAAENQELFRTVELPLVPVLTAMEQEGINLDVPFLKDFAATLEEDSARLQAQIFETSRRRIQPGFPQTIGAYFIRQTQIG